MRAWLPSIIAIIILILAAREPFAQFSCSVQPPAAPALESSHAHAIGFIAARNSEQDAWVVQGTATLVGVGSEGDQRTGFYLTAAHVIEFALRHQFQVLLLPFGDEEGAAFAEVARGAPGTKSDGTADDWAVVSAPLPPNVVITPASLRATGSATPSAAVMTAHILAEEQELEGGAIDAVDREALKNWLAGKPELKVTHLQPDGSPPADKYSGDIFPQMSGGLMVDGVGYGFGLVAMTDLNWGDARLVEDWYRLQVLQRRQIWYASVRVDDVWVEELPVNKEIGIIVEMVSNPLQRDVGLSELLHRAQGKVPMSLGDYAAFLRQCPDIREDGWSESQRARFLKVLRFFDEKFCSDGSTIATKCRLKALGLSETEPQIALQEARTVMATLSASAGGEGLPEPADLVATDLVDPFREACENSAHPDTCILSAATAVARAEYSYAEHLLQSVMIKKAVDDAVFIAHADPLGDTVSWAPFGSDVAGVIGEVPTRVAEDNRLAEVAADLATVQSALASAGELEAAGRALQSIEQAEGLGLPAGRAAQLTFDAQLAGQQALLWQQDFGQNIERMALEPEAQADWPGMIGRDWYTDLERSVRPGSPEELLEMQSEADGRRGYYQSPDMLLDFRSQFGSGFPSALPSE